MGSPPTKGAKVDALGDFAARVIAREVRLHHPVAVGTTVLDVGAGWPKYSIVLPEYLDMDACEPHEPNHRELLGWYRDVYNCVIEDFQYQWYDVVIFGDVLEHLAVPLAQRAVQWAVEHADHVLVAVPYLYPQGEVDGNPLEVHVQDDLTADLMTSRYPWLRLVEGDERKGVWSNK